MVYVSNGSSTSSRNCLQLCFCKPPRKLSKLIVQNINTDPNLSSSRATRKKVRKSKTPKRTPNKTKKMTRKHQ